MISARGRYYAISSCRLARLKRIPGLIGLVLATSLLFSNNAMATNVVIQTTLGDIELELFDEAAPLTVANFLNYINSGAYDNTFIHRSIAGFVIQGGGFTFRDEVVDAVVTNDPVINEPGISNTRGTIAMAKLSDQPNSATSSWFINTADNSENLDSQNEGFTVFGQVVGDGMLVVDAIGALQVWNASGSFTDLPLIDYPGFVMITGDHLVITNVSVVNGMVINAGINDAWVSDGAALQGMFITAYPGLGIVFLSWFTFDSVLFEGETVLPQATAANEAVKSSAAQAAVFGAQDQRWVTAVGVIDGNRAELKAELTMGGLFNNSDPLPTQDTQYGSIILEFQDCKAGEVSFDFPGVSLSGQFDIHRVLEDGVALCETLQNSETP